MILGGQNVDMMLVLTRSSEMRVFLQMRFFNDSFEKLKGEKRTWANPMNSKQWKSSYESDDLAFRFSFAFLSLFEKVRQIMIVAVHLALLY